jgi:tetratricopeptide (TPR) repeat protein
MYINRSTKFSLVVFFWIVGLACILYSGGCSESVSSGSTLNPALNTQSHEFQNQTDRPPTSKTLFAIANILAAQGRDQECEFLLKRIIQENPRCLPAYNSLAELQMRQGRINAAIDTIEDGFRIDSDDPALLNNLGVCWIVRSDYEKALEMFTKAAGIEPENARYRSNMAVALGLLSRYEESLSLFRQVLPEDQANHNLSVLIESGTQTFNPSEWQESS